ncbi:MAG TPA: sulfatase-like hydrolase/transferase [Terriglobia bacterium]|nr:sulfatase-like hydrolase/transferase [Terriglobia bacterium]
MLVLSFAAALSAQSPGTARIPRPDVILITIDTLRPDHLQCYGDTQIETPNVDALARISARFTEAFTAVPVTLPSHTALMTGSYPMSNGVHDFSNNKLSPDATPLARVLHDNGYQTAAFVSAPVLDSRFGLDLGFDTYYDHFNFSPLDERALDSTKRPADQTVDLVLNWLHNHAGPGGDGSRKPFFLWTHFYDPHDPYMPPEPYATRYRGRPYDGEIAFADAQLGRLLEGLKASGAWEHSVVVLAGDHGEGLGEHGERTHGFFIYKSTLHVPLLIHIPGAAPRVVSAGVSLVDVMPTVLQTLKISNPPSVQGRSLLSLALGETTESTSVLYAESFLPLLHFGWSPLRGLETRGVKYIEAPRPELYETHIDPNELKNVYPTRQALGRELHTELYDDLRRLTPVNANRAVAPELTDPALLDRLRSLGYVAVSSGTFAEQSGKALADPKDRITVYELVARATEDGQHGRFQASLDALQEAAKTEPTLLAIQYLEGLDYFRMKDYAQAAAKFQAAVRQEPKYALATYYLGLSQAEAGDWDAAIASFERALELDATNFEAAYNLGAAYMKKSRADEAARAFERAVQIKPDFARAYEALGEVYLYGNRAQDAAAALQRAVDLQPGFAKAHYNLGRAFEALGRTADAQREFEAAKQR